MWPLSNVGWWSLVASGSCGWCLSYFCDATEMGGLQDAERLHGNHTNNSDVRAIDRAPQIPVKAVPTCI